MEFGGHGICSGTGGGAGNDGMLGGLRSRALSLRLLPGAFTFAGVAKLECRHHASVIMIGNMHASKAHPKALQRDEHPQHRIVWKVGKWSFTCSDVCFGSLPSTPKSLSLSNCCTYMRSRWRLLVADTSSFLATPLGSRMASSSISSPVFIVVRCRAASCKLPR